MDYYNEIKSKLIDNEIYSKVKDYSKEKIKLLHILKQGDYYMKLEVGMVRI